MNNTTSGPIFYHFIPAIWHGFVTEGKHMLIILKLGKTSPCKTAVSVISVFKSYTMVKQ
jgi:hypothetical protein